jgi:hypothetical protein
MPRLVTLRLVAFISTALMFPAIHAVAQTTAERARVILEKNCAACHGNAGQPAKGISVVQWSTLATSKLGGAQLVVPRQADRSLLIQAVEGRVKPQMPYEQNPLSPGDIQVLRAWVNAGALDWTAPAERTKGRSFLSEAALLDVIVQDLTAAPKRDRTYLRYYSIANLYNNPDYTERDLELYRTSLGKLVNSLSWSRDIVQPKAIDSARTLLRIDLRSFDWTSEIWQNIIASYPYGLKPRSSMEQVLQIQSLSGAQLPYIRVDWFVANASLPPLYHQLLQLPDTVLELEQKLGVNVAQDLAQDKAIRGGVRNSGVSRNNRVVERHRSLYGAYWKSFDFADNQGPKNIFSNPVDLQPDGGEFIFHLPNGLQAYFIANKQAKRLDEAPVQIVRDKTNLDDPVVHNGRSCIGCHFQGLNTFQDEVAPLVQSQKQASFDLEKARALYVSQVGLDGYFKQDNERFQKALNETGSGVPQRSVDEPVSVLARRYQSDLTVAQAAADTALPAKILQERIAQSSELQKLGFGQLLSPSGGIKRDLWEQDFGKVVSELKLGEFLKPSEPLNHVISRTIVAPSMTPDRDPTFAGAVRRLVDSALNLFEDVKGPVISQTTTETTYAVKIALPGARGELSDEHSDTRLPTCTFFFEDRTATESKQLFDQIGGALRALLPNSFRTRKVDENESTQIELVAFDEAPSTVRAGQSLFRTVSVWIIKNCATCPVRINFYVNRRPVE